ncbi:MAG TPA: neuraminidase-like domain-containing protein, partial [Chitinophagales bacterium]|nr:neuraminidase-like domain-containing protein [Chitinophagales bacterium]
MPVRNVFTVNGTIADIDILPGSDLNFSFAGKTIELWFNGVLYDEFAGSTVTDSQNKFIYTFSTDGPSGETHQMVFRVKDGDVYLPYTLNAAKGTDNPELATTLKTGSNSVTLYLHIDISYYEKVPDQLNFLFQLLDTKQVPYSRQFLKAVGYASKATIQDLGTAITNDYGYVNFSLEATKELMILSATDSDLGIRLDVLDDDGNVVTSISVPSSDLNDKGEAIKVTVDIPSRQGKNSISISDLATKINISPSPLLNAFLTDKKIESLYDIRRVGGLQNDSALKGTEYDPDRDTILKLDAHAQIELISKNYGLNDAAVQKGYTSLYKISRSNRSEFANDIAGTVDAKPAAILSLHKSAHGMAGFLSNVVASRLTLQNHIGQPKPYDTLQTVIDSIKEKCECDDCQTGTSPFAYLSDLIQYTTNHLDKVYTPQQASAGYVNGSVTLTDLQNIFGQPFGDMRTSCDQLHENICHYRVAIEILQWYRMHYGDSGDSCLESAFVEAEKDFFQRLYFSLLNEVGADYDTLREARNDADLKQQIADDMAIVTSYPGTADTIAAITIDLSQIDPTDTVGYQAKLTLLENLFGFGSVYRNFYTTPDIPTPQIALWKKQWLKNNWVIEDYPTDDFNSKVRPIIDPDFVTIDDLSAKPADTTDKVFPIWVKRRNYIDNIWRNYFEDKTNWTPGFVPGQLQITITGATAANFISKGSIITLVATYTATAAKTFLECRVSSVTVATDTVITVNSVPDMPAGTGYTYEINYIDFLSISAISASPANIFTVTGTLSSVSQGSYIEVWGTAGNDGKYKVSSVSSSDITVSDSLNSEISIPSGARLYFQDTFSGVTVSVSNDFVLIDFDLGTEASSKDVNIYNFDGTVESFTTGPSVTVGSNAAASFDTGSILNKPSGWYKMDYVKDNIRVTDAKLGNRTLYFSGLNLSGIDTYLGYSFSGYSSPVLSLGDANQSTTKSISSVAYNSATHKSTIVINEYIPNANNQQLIISFPSVTITKAGTITFSLPNDTDNWLAKLYANPTDFPTGNANIIIDNGTNKLQVTLNQRNPTGAVDPGTSYVVTTGSTVDYTIDTPNSFATGTSSCTISVLISVSAIDIANKYFTVNEDLTDELVVGNTITITGSTGNVDDANFTISDFSVVGTSTNIYVEEVIKSSSVPVSMPYEYLSFIKTTPLLYARPDILTFFQDFITAPLGSTSTHSASSLVYSYSGSVSLPSGYPGSPWYGTSFGDLITKRDALIAGMTDDEIAALEATYMMPKEAFHRLVDIYEKYTLEHPMDLSSRVTDEEYTELFNIMTLVLKNYYHYHWLAEEAANSINLYYSQFWISFTSPKDGDIPLYNSDTAPLIDPARVSLNDLPEYRFGDVAINLWNTRQTQVSNITTYLSKIGNASLPTLMNIVLGDGVSNTGLTFDLSQLLNNLNSIDEATSLKALGIIVNNLKLTAASFQTLMQLRARFNSTNPPSQAEMVVAIGILSDAYRQRRLTGLWNAVETGTSFSIHSTNYNISENWWLASKAVLPKWRASADDRGNWIVALKNKNRKPAIDPDSVFDTDIATINSNTFDLWVNRGIEIDNEISFLTNTPYTGTDSDRINAIIEAALNVSDAGYFNNLKARKDNGEDIRPDLAHLFLTEAAYERLLTLQTLVQDVGYSHMLQEEITDFYSILVQSYKQWKWHGAWNTEEQADGILISPMFFIVPDTSYAPDPMDFYNRLPQWRATWKDRTNWEKKLKGRIDQLADVDTQMSNIVSDVEDDVLLYYQDALVNLLGTEGNTLEQNAKALSDRLLVDFNIRCCQKTTRVSQAIDTLQQLVWRKSAGILDPLPIIPGISLDFTLDANNFEEEWAWMGSYATWRAAMFVFMFPENLLLPTLRKWQSPAFIDLIDNVQGNDRLTPADACNAAKDYSKYYEDVANLDPQCTCSAYLTINNDACTNGTIQNVECTFFTFAISTKTRKAYFSTRSYSGQNTMDDFSYWQPITGLGDNVTSLIGSPVYENTVTRYIFLFATVIQDFAPKLVFIKYDLDKNSWDTDSSDLDLPDNTDYTSIQVLQRNRTDAAPKLMIQNSQTGDIMVNFLNQLGKKWQNNNWDIYAPGKSRNLIRKVVSFVESAKASGLYDEIVFALPSKDLKYYVYRTFGPTDTGRWEQATWNDDPFIGTVCLNLPTQDVQFLTSAAGGTRAHNTVFRAGNLVRPSDPNDSYPVIARFEDLDYYMRAICSVGLRHLQFRDGDFISNNHKYSDILNKLYDYTGLTANDVVTYNDAISLTDPDSGTTYNNGNSRKTTWFTYLELFQNFQTFYTRLRSYDQPLADDWRAICDKARDYIQNGFLSDNQTDAWPKFLQRRVKIAVNNIAGGYNKEFYNSTADRQDINLPNIIESLLNFTCDENGNVRNQPSDSNYPMPYVTI